MQVHVPSSISLRESIERLQYPPSKFVLIFEYNFKSPFGLIPEKILK